MKLSKLPIELTHNLLKRLPLQSQVKHRRVCTLWRELIHEQFRQLESLKLFQSVEAIELYCKKIHDNMSEDNDDDDDDDDDDVKHYWPLKPPPNDDHLIVRSSEINETSVSIIHGLFPNIRHLALVYPQSLSPYFGPLLGLYISQLVSFTLHVNAFHDSAQHDYKIIKRKIIYSLNQLPLKLKHLHLFAQSQVHHQFDHLFNVPVLSSLRHVLRELESLSLPGVLWRSVPKYTPSLTRLRLDVNYAQDRVLPEPIHYIPVEMALNLTHLRLIGLSGQLYGKLFQLNSIAMSRHYQSLHSLSIGFQSNTKQFTFFLRDLSKLPHLTKLEFLNLSPYNHRKLNFPHPPEENSPMKLVKELKLPDIFSTSHLIFDGERFCQTLALWFPRLERLIMPTVYSLVRRQIEANRGRYLRRLKYCQLDSL